MSRLIRYIAYIALFFACFAIFLYWVFPYDVLKDRILNDVESQLGKGLQVSADRLEPYWFSGIDIKNLRIEGVGEHGIVDLLKFSRVRARASLVPLIFGSIRLKFGLDIGKGELSGFAKVGEDTISLDLDIDDLNLSDFAFIQERTGLKVMSKIDGNVELEINRQQPARSAGSMQLTFANLGIGASELKVGDLALEMPDLVLAKGRDSQIKLTLSKGAATFEKFNLAEGDLLVDLKGKMFLSSKFANYRLNLRGKFSTSQKLNEALPFLFIVDSQKQEDGSYPLIITGRISRPSIKIGTFTLPL
ncbi:MAG: type II secretion system protein GspN [Pseudomonadota bacterium]